MSQRNRAHSRPAWTHGCSHGGQAITAAMAAARFENAGHSHVQWALMRQLDHISRAPRLACGSHRAFNPCRARSLNAQRFPQKYYASKQSQAESCNRSRCPLINIWSPHVEWDTTFTPVLAHPAQLTDTHTHTHTPFHLRRWIFLGFATLCAVSNSSAGWAALPCLPLHMSSIWWVWRQPSDTSAHEWTSPSLDSEMTAAPFTKTHSHSLDTLFYF